jgi:hypothetical protein
MKDEKRQTSLQDGDVCKGVQKHTHIHRSPAVM